MSKFNTAGSTPAVFSPVTSTSQPDTRTYEGAPGHTRSVKAELFLLAITNKVKQATFYENARGRDDRYVSLIQTATLADPDWTTRFLGWLRSEANMRSAPIVGAVEFAKTRYDHKIVDDSHTRNQRGLVRRVVDSVLQRADEPGELIAYWHSKYGRNIPTPVKRGVADAAIRLYNEKSLLKYDSPDRAIRFGDVIALTHAGDTKNAGGQILPDWQAALFAHAINRRHNRDFDTDVNVGMLPTLALRAELMATPVDERRDMIQGQQASEILRTAGMTWEALAGWLQGPMDKTAWEAMIPSMPYTALMRNLNNFDEAGVSDTVAELVAERLTDPERVTRSREFPFRFWAAYKNTSSLRWAHPLEKALNHALSNVPHLDKRTLVLVDRSPSTFPGYHYSTPNDSDIPLAEQGAVFGSALALRAANPTLVEFGGTSKELTVPKGGSVLRLIESFGQISGTDIPSAVRRHFAGHDRIVIITDEQTRPGYLPSNMAGHGGMQETAVDVLVPRNVPVYMWNMGGYRPGAMPSGSENRHTFGGLTDKAFTMINLLESNRDAAWPF